MSMSNKTLLVIVEPSHVKRSGTSSATSSMLTYGDAETSRTMPFEFYVNSRNELLTVMVELSNQFFRFCSVCVVVEKDVRFTAKTHPCFTPLSIGKFSEVSPSKPALPSVISWKGESTQQLGDSQFQWLLLLTRSNAIERSIKAMYCSILSLWHFYREKIMLTLDPVVLNLYWDSGQIRSATT